MYATPAQGQRKRLRSRPVGKRWESQAEFSVTLLSQTALASQTRLKEIRITLVLDRRPSPRFRSATGQGGLEPPTSGFGDKHYARSFVMGMGFSGSVDNGVDKTGWRGR